MSADATAHRAADIIQRGFEKFHESFRAITRRALERFERRDWQGIRRDTVRRLHLHARAVDDTLALLREEFDAGVQRRDFWARAKNAYSQAILGTDDFELAQTFFNSLTRRVFSHVGVEPEIDYLSRDFPLPFLGWELSSARMYAVRTVTTEVVHKILEDAGFRAPFRDLDDCSRNTASRIRSALRETWGAEEVDTLDFLRPVFIRSKAAYLIGRARKQLQFLPLVVAILHEKDGLVVDGVVHDEDEISIIFSFARWYFHADLASPRQVIGFLHSLLPRKRISELYTSLGYNKHGKSYFFGDLTSYIDSSTEPFVIAPGQRGLVMSVFTLESYEFVFKVIRDRFPASKQTTRRRIREHYRQVLLQDRAGRLVDFQEYEHLRFPRHRFSKELLEELLQTASKSVGLAGDSVIVHHLYIGRRVTPLDLYLETADADSQRRVVIDWGNSVKELAASNIFAGDMLLKNFGVTRHGRVVFYDYDELCPLSDCRFRLVPEPHGDDQILASEPWFTVHDGEVFPAEFRTFLGLPGPLRSVFEVHHADLFEVDFWQAIQEANRVGEVIDIFPYAESQRRQEEERQTRTQTRRRRS